MTGLAVIGEIVHTKTTLKNILEMMKIFLRSAKDVAEIMIS
jgi:hypothetical protein